MASRTKFWATGKGASTRVLASGTKQGCGGSTRMYVGNGGGSTHRYFLQPTLDWTDVGKIIRAELIVYTDDLNGAIPSSDSPQIKVARLTTGFTVGDNADGVYTTDDYTAPLWAASPMPAPLMAAAAGFVTRIDITGIVDLWAPVTVKRSTGATGTPQTAHGLALIPSSTSAEAAWGGWSEDYSDSALRPVIELVYEPGLTAPNAPTGLTPTGSVASLDAFEGDFSDSRASDTLAYSEVQVYTNAVTASGQTISLNGGALLWSKKQKASANEITDGRSSLNASAFPNAARVTYKYRLRHYDNEGQVSPWTALVSFSVSNTDPDAPTLTPDGSTYDSLSRVLFRGGTFSDPDGDKLQAYQVQLSTLSSPTDPLWDDSDFLLWDTGKVFVGINSTEWQRPYGGQPLSAATYYWRARQWDRRNGASEWAYATLTLTADFEPESGQSDTVQIDPQVPWRIVIRGMHSNGNRGPGDVVAVLENAKSVGASLMYNSPGELHFTLPVDHPQISVIEPKQTHYTLELYQGDGWRHAFEGLVWDIDATETSVVFYGIDYLSLLDFVADERYDPANPDKPYTQGGSKYVDKTVTEVVTNQLQRAINQTDSPVAFMVLGTIAAMNEKVTIWSTMQPTLSFVTGLLDSHRQGTGLKTRIKVIRVNGSSTQYQIIVEDDPGVQRDNIRLRYGELVQGYRVIVFDTSWASLMHGIGRTREGLRVLYKSESAPGLDQSVWGRFAQVRVFDGVSDENDLIRRLKQAAIGASKLGKRIALGVRSGALLPRDGYDICDSLPVDIEHGAISTSAYGSGYWTVYGIAWEASDKGETNTTLTILPREDTTAPDSDLIPTRPISPQAEWQVGWQPPNPVDATSRYWLDQTTGKVYERDESSVYEEALGITGVAATDLITAASAHGLAAGDTVYFPTLTGGSGLTVNTRYYVIASGLTATEFRVSTTLGGSTVNWTSDITAGTLQKTAVYNEIVSGVMAPPETLDTPAAPTLFSDVHDLVVRLKVTL